MISLGQKEFLINLECENVGRHDPFGGWGRNFGRTNVVAYLYHGQHIDNKYHGQQYAHRVAIVQLLDCLILRSAVGTSCVYRLTREEKELKSQNY